MWKSSLGLAVGREVSSMDRLVHSLFGETCGTAGGRSWLALSGSLLFQSARRCLHLPFCPMKVLPFGLGWGQFLSSPWPF